MTRREKDLKGLREYIEKMGVRVVFVSRIANAHDTLGEYDANELVIKVSTKENKSILSRLLTLLHEFGHHIDYVERGWSDREIDAYNQFDECGASAPNWTKRSVWYSEENANKYMIPVATTLGIKLPSFLFKLDLENTRKRLRLSFKYNRILTKDWVKIKQKTRRKVKKSAETEHRRIRY